VPSTSIKHIVPHQQACTPLCGASRPTVRDNPSPAQRSPVWFRQRPQRRSLRADHQMTSPRARDDRVLVTRGLGRHGDLPAVRSAAKRRIRQRAGMRPSEDGNRRIGWLTGRLRRSAVIEWRLWCDSDSRWRDSAWGLGERLIRPVGSTRPNDSPYIGLPTSEAPECRRADGLPAVVRITAAVTITRRLGLPYSSTSDTPPPRVLASWGSLGTSHSLERRDDRVSDRV